jgi:spore germination protein PE
MTIQRNSLVKFAGIKSMLFGSVLEVGDSVQIRGHTEALAVQRRKQLFYAHEGDLRSFPAFQKPIPLPAIYEPFTASKINGEPNIRVGNLHVIAVSTASVVHVGSTSHVAMEARVKHIRQITPTI